MDYTDLGNMRWPSLLKLAKASGKFQKLVIFYSIFALLQELISHMEKNPESLMKVLRKRRVEEVENAGFFSMLKASYIHLAVITGSDQSSDL